jgi:hypothetical protein
MTYDTMPTLRKWQSDSSVALATRDKDIVLKRIDQQLDNLNKAADAAQKFICLSDLYFMADYWLKIYKSNSLMEKGRAPAMQALFTRAAYDMCTTFNCTINGLPRELELMWGREMTAGGVKRDLLDQCAEYITRADAAKYKVYFKNGLAYQFPWWNHTLAWRRQLVNSRFAYDPQAVVLTANRPGALPNRDYGFFVLTMSRDLYMAKHRPGAPASNGNRANMGFYHSAYTAGEPIACAGTMLIHDGVISRVRFDSGHYQPHNNNALALVMALRMWGVNVDRIAFEDFNARLLGTDPYSPVQDPDVGTARYILKHTDALHKLLRQRDQTIADNQSAFARRPAANPDPNVTGPNPRDWWGNRPHQPDARPPGIKKF